MTCNDSVIACVMTQWSYDKRPTQFNLMSEERSLKCLCSAWYILVHQLTFDLSYLTPKVNPVMKTGPTEGNLDWSGKWVWLVGAVDMFSH